MRRLGAALLIIASATLAWLAWFPPAIMTHTAGVRAPLPKSGVQSQEKWRVVSRRIVWKQAADAMQERLRPFDTNFELLQRKEPVELHAFDDPRSFRSQAAAEKAKAAWRKAGVEAEVLKRETTFGVGLGRFFLVDYAEQMQERLKRIGRPYHYERRTVTIPTYRFVSPPLDEKEAGALWQKMQDLGIAGPVLMQESRYEELYTTPDAGAKR